MCGKSRRLGSEREKYTYIVDLWLALRVASFLPIHPPPLVPGEGGSEIELIGVSKVELRKLRNWVFRGSKKLLL